MDRLPSVGEFSTIGKIWRKFEKNKVILELKDNTKVILELKEQF